MKYSSDTRYGTVAQAFHWLTAIFVLAAFIYGPGSSEARVYAVARDFERQIHETLGLCVLALVVLRLLWRWVDKHPEPALLPKWMDLAAKLVQGLLYVLLFAVPMTAVTGAWLQGHPLTLLAGLQIAPQLALSHDTGTTIATLHTWLGDAILWVAGFHAIAAIYHHLFLKDDVLSSMLPVWVPLYRPKGD